ncbi:hypothetical protein L1987_21083 [Smallanthus sonchifolius]|uniref:Uncharacterized protein n=1 Tax=Smallanthus sonchifolius TaxID=185202 RepID=A0ACB9IWH2_9ASTR|nr:hypothetical protein L1987_21083 [Smallanthus sonchifolius]
MENFLCSDVYFWISSVIRLLKQFALTYRTEYEKPFEEATHQVKSIRRCKLTTIGWLNSVINKRSEGFDSVSNSQLDSAMDELNSGRDPEVEEEYQIQLALELSAR